MRDQKAVMPSRATPAQQKELLNIVSEDYPEFQELQDVTYHLPYYAGGWKDYLIRWAMYLYAHRQSMRRVLSRRASGEIDDDEAVRASWNHLMRLTATHSAVKTRFPFYVVTPTLWESLTHTDVTPEFDVFSFNPGLPVIDFIVPYIAGNEFCEQVYLLRYTRLEQSHIEAYAAYEHVDAHGLADALGVDIYVGMEVIRRDKDLTPTGTGALSGKRDSTVRAMQEDAADNPILQQAIAYTFQMAHLLTERKDLESKSTTTRKATRHKNETRTPRFLGQNYRILGGPSKSAGVSTGIHQRLHMRRGHYRSQPFGEGRLKRKTIWIEPCWAGGSEGTE